MLTFPLCWSAASGENHLPLCIVAYVQRRDQTLGRFVGVEDSDWRLLDPDSNTWQFFRGFVQSVPQG